jgi:hypothetical protein
VEERGQLVLQHHADPAAELHALVGRARVLSDDPVDDAAGDLTGEPALLGLRAERGARVSITVISGSPSSTARRIPRRASLSAPGPIGRSRVWPRRS